MADQSSTSDGQVSAEDMQMVEDFRKKMDGKIPKDLDTDFNLCRWVHVYEDKLDQLPKQFMLYVENRKVSGADNPKITEMVHKHPLAKRYLRYMPVSLMAHRAINQHDGSIVRFERAGGFKFEKILKVVKMGDFLSMFFMYNEYCNRLLQEMETKTGKMTYTQVVVDCDGIHLADYANPMGVPALTLKLMTTIGETWFGDLNNRFYIVNAPSMVNIIVQIAKRLMSKRNQDRLMLLHKGEDLAKYISPNALPKCYGGELTDDSGWGGRDTCCNEVKEVQKSEYYKVGLVFEGIDTPKMSHEKIAHGKTFTAIRTVTQANSVLAYQFTLGGECEFTVFHVNADGLRTRIVPQLLMMTPKIPEENVIKCTEPGEYHFEFINSTHYWFSVKLSYAIVPRPDIPESLRELFEPLVE